MIGSPLMVMPAASTSSRMMVTGGPIHIIGAVTRHVGNAAQAAIAARVEQRLGKLQSPENRGPWRAPIGGALDLIGNRFGGFRAIEERAAEGDPKGSRSHLTPLA